MIAGTRVLVAGAGTRVARFIVPALIEAGVDPDHITVFRRSRDGLGALRTVTALDELDLSTVRFTFNCVAAGSMVAVQTELLRRCRGARHFCDTPTFAVNQELWRVAANSRHRLHSLEDWPFMANLAFFAREAIGAEAPSQLTIEKFGIVGHFLSLYRTMHGSFTLRNRQLAMHDNDLVGSPRANLRVVFRTPKQLPVAKVSLRTPSMLVEDFHEVESATHDNDEVVYRVVDDRGIRYLRGDRAISQHQVSATRLAAFEPFDDRQQVHELDKFVALCGLFRGVLAETAVPYPYLSSVRDALTARRLQARRASPLL